MNVVSVIGNLTKDPELTTGGERTVCRMRLGIGSRGRSVFADVRVFEADARRCARLSRGDAVAVSGRLSMSRWTGRDGVERSQLYILARSVHFLTADGLRRGVDPTGDVMAEAEPVEA